MDYGSLKTQFIQTRQEQMQQYERDFTETDRLASQVVFNAAIDAIENVKTGNRSTCLQAVSLSTGLGKSTSAYAFIATFAKYDSDFSAAYIVPTIKMGEEAKKGIEAILGPRTVKLWTSLHKHKGVDTTKAMQELGRIPEETSNKAELPTSRIIVITHGQLLRELRTGIDEGALNYMGTPRSVVFIDEDPELVQNVGATAAGLQRFHDDLVKHHPGHHWLPIVSDVVHKMSAITRSNGQTYIPAKLLTLEEGKAFEDYAGLSLWEETDDEECEQVRCRHLEGMENMVDFLKAASRGNVYYSRYDSSFFAYKLHFDTSYSGFVLLDATSDIAGLICLHPNVKMIDGPQVNYERLEILHMGMPSKFRKIKDVVEVKATGVDYGRLIRQYVLANSYRGADVLVVVHKAVLTQELIEASEDPDIPLDWEGRMVNTQNWGAGVGLNKFKNKTHVFLFGDFYKPRFATISHTHGWSQEPVTEEGLRLAEGKRKAGEIFVPQGDYLRSHEGHLLRWTKQLAMRGTARQVDGEGKCLPMKLFTTMDLERLIPNIERLFPGANNPVSANDPQDIQIQPVRGRQGLIKLLMNTRKAYLGADEVEAVTGIVRSKLSREFEAIEELIVPLGWSLKTASDLNYPGRMKYVVNDARLAQLLLKRA